MDNQATKMFVDAGLTIPVSVNDPAIRPLIDDWQNAIQDQTVAVEFATKKVKAAETAINRAITIVSESDLAEDDPRAIGIKAELEAVRTQSAEACNAALMKMRAVVAALARIETAARNQNPHFN